MASSKQVLQWCKTEVQILWELLKIRCLEENVKGEMLQDKVHKCLKMKVKNYVKGKVMQHSQRRAFSWKVFLMAAWPILCFEGHPIQLLPLLEWHSQATLVTNSLWVHALKVKELCMITNRCKIMSQRSMPRRHLCVAIYWTKTMWSVMQLAIMQEKSMTVQITWVWYKTDQWKYCSILYNYK